MAVTGALSCAEIGIVVIGVVMTAVVALVYILVRGLNYSLNAKYDVDAPKCEDLPAEEGMISSLHVLIQRTCAPVRSPHRTLFQNGTVAHLQVAWCLVYPTTHSLTDVKVLKVHIKDSVHAELLSTGCYSPFRAAVYRSRRCGTRHFCHTYTR